MNEELAFAKLKVSESRVNAQIFVALEHAREARDKNIKYLWGGKSGEALDCSGLVTSCYPDLCQGVVKQYEQLRGWLFKDFELVCAEQGDIVFFAKVARPDEVSHVAIVERIAASIAHVIHSSERRGGVVMDEFNLDHNVFRERYLAVAIAKIRPFLFRRFLDEEILKG
jgi:cell wall-associated NlpC family hydrolase